MTDDFMDSLGEGLRYPWNKPVRLFNVLWVLLPILGWFALIGYVKRIVKELVAGNRAELPSFGSFGDNLADGFMVFLLFIPTWIALMILNVIPIIGAILALLVNLFLVPWLTINFFVKGDFGALWEIKKAYHLVTAHAKEYVMALLKTLVYTAVYWLLSIILIGFPCNMFGSMYFMTEFYNRHH